MKLSSVRKDEEVSNNLYKYTWNILHVFIQLGVRCIKAFAADYLAVRPLTYECRSELRKVLSTTILNLLLEVDNIFPRSK